MLCFELDRFKILHIRLPITTTKWCTSQNYLKDCNFNMVIIEDFSVNNVIKKVLEMSQVSAHYIRLSSVSCCRERQDFLLCSIFTKCTLYKYSFLKCYKIQNPMIIMWCHKSKINFQNPRLSIKYTRLWRKLIFLISLNWVKVFSLVILPAKCD